MKNNTRPPFYLPSRRLRLGIHRTMNFNEMLFLPGSLQVRTRTPLGTFVTNLSETPAFTCITRGSFSSSRLLANSSPSGAPVWVSGILPTTHWQCGNLQTCLSSKPEFSGSTNQRSKLHLSSTGRTSEYVMCKEYTSKYRKFYAISLQRKRQQQREQ